MPVPASSERLRISPNFVSATSMDGRTYVAKETEPYVQYWLSERDRVLYSLFGGRLGATIDDALKAYFRLTRTAPSALQRTLLLKSIADMRRATVLIGTADDTSRYDARVVDAYTSHRPFPRVIADLLVASAGIVGDTRVLDLAGGPGDLALALAETSRHVSLMELSRAFLTAARHRARARGVSLTPLHESCNRLVHRDDDFDVITVSQALHWLDDVQVARGVCRTLRPDGSFFVIQSAIEVADNHPMASVLGRHSILGPKTTTFAEDLEPLRARLTLLFDALDAPAVHRMDRAQRWDEANGRNSRIVPAGVSLFRQRRPFGLGFVRGFVTDEHIRPTGQAPAAFWKALESSAATAPDEALMGTHHWAVLHFKRGGPRAAVTPIAALPATDIGFDAPPAAATVRARARATTRS